MPENTTVRISPAMTALIEVQADVIPFLRDSHYPRPKLAELETLLERAFDSGEIFKGRGPSKGAKYRKAAKGVLS